MTSSSRSTTRGYDRRQFLHRCAGCAVLGGCTLGTIGAPTRPAYARPLSQGGKPRVRLVFSHIPPGSPTWPFIDYDYEVRKQFLTDALVRACPEIDLLPVTAHNIAEAKKLLEEDKDIDGYISYTVGIWTGVPATLAATGKPTLFVDDLYAGSGEFLIQYATALRAGRNVAGVSSSRLDDVISAVKCFGSLEQPGAAAGFAASCMASQRKKYGMMGDMTPAAVDAAPKFDVTATTQKLRESTIIVVGQPMHAVGPQITEVLGPKVVQLDFAPLAEAYTKADRAQAQTIADGWLEEAQNLVEPSGEDVRKSAAMYLAMKALMAHHNACAITINCLGGFYGGHLAAYPCLGFSQLNNDGLVGACEADLWSTITMLAMSCLVGRPGYISDPVIDTSKHQIVYAHCVAPFKVYGPGGPTNPYQIRSHSEDRKGASVRSLMPLGRMTTTMEFDPARKQVLLHQGKTVENIDEDKACRTKLAADVKGDLSKLMAFWDQWGWHRVTFFGDLKAPVLAFADKVGFGVVEEA